MKLVKGGFLGELYNFSLQDKVLVTSQNLKLVENLIIMKELWHARVDHWIYMTL